MDAFEAIKGRRSIRKYTGAPVAHDDLEAIVDAGRLAASGHNNQPWEFVVVTDRATIEKLSIASAWMAEAGAVIVVVLDPSSRWWQEDGAAAMENMMLAATALGYGSCWVEGGALPHEETIKQLLGVPAIDGRCSSCQSASRRRAHRHRSESSPRYCTGNATEADLRSDRCRARHANCGAAHRGTASTRVARPSQPSPRAVHRSTRPRGAAPCPAHPAEAPRPRSVGGRGYGGRRPDIACIR